VAVLVPDWMGSAQGQQTQRTSPTSSIPEKRYRALSDCVGNFLPDTIAESPSLAEECLELENTMRPSAIRGDPGAADGR